MKLWNVKAAVYFRFRRLPLFRRLLDSEIANLRSLLRAIPSPYQLVIDLGTGAGSTLDIFPDSVSIIGLDHSPNMSKNAVKNRHGLLGVIGSTHHLPFRKNCTSMVSAIGITEYLRDKENFVNEVQRILKNQGYVLITISQPSFLNKLRNLLGERIYPIDPERWKKMLNNAGWICLGEKSTLIQKQYLYRI
jgi:ubiquinone/menaquinone biosynthesis C-methylase UbiE